MTLAPCNGSKASIQVAAEQISSDFAVMSGCMADQDGLHAFISRLGGRRRTCSPLELARLGDMSLEVRGVNDFELRVPNYTGPLHDRFNLAHDLGHYFLHTDQGERPASFGRTGSGLLEWEANWFAMALLMPAQAVRDHWAGCQDVTYACGVFAVPRVAMERRLTELGLLALTN